MREPLISVIVPAFNRGAPLRDTVKSVLNQTYSRLELIVVDDCSTIPVAQILESIAREDSRLKIVRQERNQGVSAARNSGLELAQGDLIALLDHDDLWLPEKLARQRSLMEDRGYPACVTNIASHDFPEYSRCNSKRDMEWLILTGSFLAMASAMLAQREIVDAVGPFNTDLPALQDWEWLLRFHRKGYKLGIVPEYLTIYGGSHRRPPEIEFSDLEFIRREYIPALPRDEGKVLDAALKWRKARVRFIWQSRFFGAIELAGVALQHPIHFSRYLWTVYEDSIRSY
jgi:glycosyltransferase involved in cell wall biosynthesis